MRVGLPVGLLVCVLVWLLLAAAPARADVTVDLTGANAADFAAAMGMTEQELEDAIRDDLADLFNVARPGEYITQISNAQAFSSKGIGVDYASTIEHAVVGIAVNLSAAADSDTLSGDARPVGGIAPNLTLMAGVNLGALGAPAVTLYGNFFTRGFSYRDFDATLRNAGFHVQISLARPKKPKPGEPKENIIVRWGGIDLTSGIEWSYLELELPQQLDTTFEVAGSGSSRADVIADTMGLYTLSSSSFSVPIEVTTSLRFLYLASLYGGVGIDFQTGAADLDINLTGTLTGRDSNGNTTDLGDVTITANDEGKPSTGRFRGLLGTQVNLGPVRIFAQLNYRPLAAIGVAAGLRLAW